jgi:homoserine O-succinyltransferase/O-acetyltransferase
MALIIDGGRIPTRWAKKKGGPAGSIGRRDVPASCIRVALVNNMPDAALEDTEMQFFGLLDAAAGDVPVLVKLHSLPELPRGEQAQQHLRNFYFGFDDLWNSRFNGVIITGTEPRQPNLRDEPYWRSLADLLDWAAESTVSTVASCLAAHANALYNDGIERHRLDDKRFGVFKHWKACDHPLIKGTADPICIPHSRWNEVREDALVSCGYTVLTRSADAGADMFVKKRKNSLFVHFQGHPEYGIRSLLKEYRRDVRRFLKQERGTYPSMPEGYFDAAGVELLRDFREKALAHPQEEVLASFPEAAISARLQNTWQLSAARVYKNWLQYLLAHKADSSAFATVARDEHV